MTTVVLIHDEACGVCSDLAPRLMGVLAASVTLRSCRDPDLGEQLPILRPYLVAGPCRRPLAVIARDDGRVQVAGGLWMVARLGPLVRAGRWPTAVRLGMRMARQQARKRIRAGSR